MVKTGEYVKCETYALNPGMPTAEVLSPAGSDEVTVRIAVATFGDVEILMTRAQFHALVQLFAAADNQDGKAGA
jgi:hypothetical protein